MSGLPPYSTYRTDSKQLMYPQATSHGNILTFTPPGFKQEINVKFPDSRLAVCAKCKKNFKTRDMCRVRNTHTSPPWTTAYICITIHESCFDKEGKFVDKPMTVRMVQWQPYCVKKPFDAKTPVCAQCKRTNRTKGFCRERHKHRQLPWCSVYVLLSTMEAADPSTVVAGASRRVDEQDTASSGGDVKEDSSVAGTETIASDSGNAGDDVNDIAESRTFLAMVNCRSISIHWLDLAENETGTGDANPFPTMQMDAAAYPHPAMGMHPMDPSHAHQFYPNMNYAAQQHQLQSRQQYFFHLQQQQQFPPGVAPPWQQPPHLYHMGQLTAGEPSPGGTTAGDAAAAQQRQGGDSSTPPQHPPPMVGPPPHWAAAYYPPTAGPYAAPPLSDQNGHPPMAALPEMNSEGGGQPALSTEDNGSNDDDEHDSKRQRMV